LFMQADLWGSQSSISARNRPTHKQTTRRHIPEHRTLVLVH